METPVIWETFHDSYVDRYTLEGKVVDIISNLHEFVEKHGEDVQIQWELDYDDQYTHRVGHYRPMNEEELAAHEARKKVIAECRRAQYEQLKKEFEGDSE